MLLYSIHYIQNPRNMQYEKLFSTSQPGVQFVPEKDLRKAAANDEVWRIAQVRTLTILPRLDSFRRRSVLQFLYGSGLIDKDKQAIKIISGADLSGIDLSGLVLYKADLSGTNLTGADLHQAYLGEACLSDADLRRPTPSQAEWSQFV